MKWKRVAAMALAAVFLISGFLMACRSFGQLRENVIDQHRQKLTDVAVSVDRTAMGYFQIYQQTLAYITGRQDFLAAETEWLSTGDPDGLLRCMEEHLPGLSMQFRTILAVRDETVIASTDGSTGYQIPGGTEAVFLCRDPMGQMCIGIRHRTGALCYAAVIRPDDLCSYLAEGSAVSGTAQMVLMDRTGTAAIRYQSGSTTVQVLTEDLLRHAPVLELVRGAIGTVVPASGLLETGTGTMGYILIGGGGSLNGYFTVCILENSDAQLQVLQRETMELIVCCLLIAGGVGLLVLYMGSLRRENLRAAAELEELKQRQETLERIRQESQQLAHHQRLQTIGTLTSSIAHEFNNLLTPIMSYSLLTLEKLPEEAEELYDNVLEIYNASKKAKVIISRLSDLSRKNSPRTFQPVCLDEQVQRALDLAMSARPEGVEVTLDLNCWDLRIRANEIQICQLLLNLILNAFQAMESGGRLHIATTFDDDQVHLQAEDTGCGIEKELQDRIFDPFFTTKEPGKGTGLGLAIAAQAVQEHGGTITVESKPGAGTRFRVNLPRM